jgi:hypothetical protein
VAAFFQDALSLFWRRRSYLALQRFIPSYNQVDPHVPPGADLPRLESLHRSALDRLDQLVSFVQTHTSEQTFMVTCFCGSMVH